MNTLELLIARNGGKLFPVGAHVALKANQYVFAVVNEDAVISVLTDADTNNVHSQWGLAAQTIKTGMIISPSNNGIFETMTIVSGSVFLIKNG